MTAAMPIQTLAMFALVAFAVGGVIWVFVYPLLSGERQAELRQQSVTRSDPAAARTAATSRAGPKVRREQVEESLKELELRQKKAKNFRVRIEGEPAPGVGAKDFALAVIGEIGTAGGTGYVIEYAGSAVRALSMEGRMTLCNLTIEGGARAGLVAPDETTFEYLKGRPAAPKGGAWEMALDYWKTFFTDQDAVLDAGVPAGEAATIATEIARERHAEEAACADDPRAAAIRPITFGSLEKKPAT